ncbi:MAG: PEGA domain-containing protein [Lachnospiraceae bacterium]|nr:PEGA domain-containing protein [Lachnospiraceae bacterium]
MAIYMKYGKEKRKRFAVVLGLICMLLAAGCSFKKNQNETNPDNTQGTDTGFILTGPGSFDSADTAVVVRINKDEEKITFLNLTINRNYTLQYDGTTVFSDKYGQSMSLEQIREGDIVYVTFLKSKKRLATLAISGDSWTTADISRYQFDVVSHDVTIGNEIYKVTENTKIFSNGEEIEMMDLNSADILTFNGIGNTVHSIVVEKGHGYLRLSGDENFIGGWIEIGQNIIYQITEDMLLTVPEGSYQVLISTKGGGGTKSVIINRNTEVTLDIGDLEVEAPQYGQVLFAMSPSSASLYVDGNLVDTSLPVTLEYGIHQLMARADGYSTVTSYLKVAQESAGIDITLDLEKDDEEEEEENNEETVSSGNGTTTASYYQVYIDAPEGAEVYLDGNYIGICPISFKKVEGPHVITLRRTGYETRSYTIQVDGEDKDISYSFAELSAN